MPSFASVKSVASATNPPAFVKYYPLTNSLENPTGSQWITQTTPPATLKFISRKGFVTRRNDPITDMSFMFRDVNTFNDPDIGLWDVSSVTSMDYMFLNASAFNQPIGDWNTSNVSNIAEMFNGASAFNQDLRWWDVSHIAAEPTGFGGAAGWTFKPLWGQTLNYYPLTNSATDPTNSTWRTNVGISYRFKPNDGIYTLPGEPITSMDSMFFNRQGFNDPDINSWDVSSVTNMDNMFQGATAFNQDLSGWCVTNITLEPTNFSTGSPLTTENKPVWGSCP